MKRMRHLIIAVALLFGVAAFGQSDQHQGTGQGEGQGHGQGMGHGRGMPTVEEHLKVLTEQLNLSEDQQAKAKKILQDQQEDTRKLRDDQNMSREDRMEKARAAH